MLSKKRIILILLVSVFISGCFLVVVLAKSYSGTIFGRTTWDGYFMGAHETVGVEVLPPISSSSTVTACNLKQGDNKGTKGDGNAIPACIDSTDEFSQFLKSYNASGDVRKRTGAAFIVCTMLGDSEADCVSDKYINSKDKDKRKITSAGWTELNSRLSNADVIWKKWVTINPGDINSFYQDSKKYDDAFFANNVDESHYAIIFHKKGTSTERYRLFRSCANPIGDLPGLIKPTWSITPSSLVTKITDSTGMDTHVTNTAQPGYTIVWAHQVKNIGPFSTDRDLKYYYTNAQGFIDNGANGSDHSVSSGFDVGDNTKKFDSTYLVATGDAGKRLCRTTTVIPYAWNTNLARTSGAACVDIGVIVNSTKPKVQIWGGDLMVGKLFNGVTSAPSSFNVTTSLSSSGTNTFGSWVEYAIFAKGIITNTASGSGQFNSTTVSNNLSFANTGNRHNCLTTASVDSSTIGCYSNARKIPYVAASFPKASAQPITSTDVDLGLGSLQTGLYTTTSDLTISGGEINKGQWIVINAPDVDVNIIGEINYYGGNDLKSISDIPQVVIIAKNINIAGSVNKIDAWLIASGSINTCSDVATDADLRTDKCNEPLQVNGPVMAGKLYLRRTWGKPDDGTPAEEFNLRADAYLWAYSQASKNNRALTVYSTELPPRY